MEDPRVTWTRLCTISNRSRFMSMNKRVSFLFHVTRLMWKRNDCEIPSHCPQAMYTKLREIHVEILQLSQQLSVSTSNSQHIRNRFHLLRERWLCMTWHWQEVLHDGWKMFFSKDFPDKELLLSCRAARDSLCAEKSQQGDGATLSNWSGLQLLSLSSFLNCYSRYYTAERLGTVAGTPLAFMPCYRPGRKQQTVI